MKIVKFFISNCFHCRRIEPEFDRLADKYKESGIEFINQYVSADSGLDKKYGLTIFPTVILLDDNDNEVRRIEGVIPPEMLTKFVEGAVNEFGK